MLDIEYSVITSDVIKSFDCIMHFIEINYMSCIPWLFYFMYSMAKTCLYMNKTKYYVIIKSCALI